MAEAWVAAPDEAPAVARLIAGFRDYYGRPEPTDATILAAVTRLIVRDDTDYLLAAAAPGSEPLGVLQLRFRDSVWTGAPDAWLEDLFVDGAARRQGLAEALIALAFDRAEARGARRIELDTWEDNDPAIALYRRWGFSERSKGNDGRDLFFGASLPRP
jgi:ribosomal protein S18 acetylase RimI-like enzyme